jgi:hypothetical protein
MRTMSGSRTRFGFAGAEDARPTGQHTLLGHELHRQQPEVPPPEAPPEPGPPPSPEPAQLEPAPGPSGKSHLPAVAKVFGRWNSEGELQAHTPPPMPVPPTLAETVDLHDELELPPRETIGRPLLIVVGVAVFCFVVVGLVARLARPTPEPPPPVVAPEPLAPPSDSPRLPTQAQARPPAPKAPPARRTRPRNAPVADPDNVLPPRFLR